MKRIIVDTYCNLFNGLVLFSRIDGSATKNDTESIIKIRLMDFVNIVVNIQYLYRMEHINQIVYPLLALLI